MKEIIQEPIYQLQEEDNIKVESHQDKMKRKRFIQKKKLESIGYYKTITEEKIKHIDSKEVQMSKDQTQKMKNRDAAQKSREKKKQFVDLLVEENTRLKQELSRCKLCPHCKALNEKSEDTQSQTENQSMLARQENIIISMNVELEFDRNFDLEFDRSFDLEFGRNENILLEPSLSTDSTSTYVRVSVKDEINFVSAFLFICLLAICVIVPLSSQTKDNEMDNFKLRLLAMKTESPKIQVSNGQIFGYKNESKQTNMSMVEIREVNNTNITGNGSYLNNKCYETLVGLTDQSQHEQNLRTGQQGKTYGSSIILCRERMRIFYGNEANSGKALKEEGYYEIVLSGLELIEMFGANCVLPSGALLEPNRMYFLRSKLLSIEPFQCE